MINWLKFNIKVENQARLQFEHYFEDLEKILNEQNLSFKKSEVFRDLENHIIDYIKNKQIELIDFKAALKIIEELGPPDEYADFSNFPSIQEQIQKKELKALLPATQSSLDELVLCQNCNAKNESSSIFCINCGLNLPSGSNYYQKTKENSFKFSINSNLAYFMSLLTFYVLALFFIVYQIDYPRTFELSLIIIFIEIIILPILFFLQLIDRNFSKFQMITSIGSYLLKFLSLIIYFFISDIFGYYSFLGSFLFIIILVVLPIISTKIIYSVDYSVVMNLKNMKLGVLIRLIYFLIYIISYIVIYSILILNMLVIEFVMITILILILYFIFEIIYYKKPIINSSKYQNKAHSKFNF
jgi:hypothetical protein